MSTIERDARGEEIGRGGTYKTLDEQAGRLSPAEERGAVLCVVGVIAMANVVGLV
jgi:hypothetical protein